MRRARIIFVPKSISFLSSYPQAAEKAVLRAVKPHLCEIIYFQE